MNQSELCLTADHIHRLCSDDLESDELERTEQHLNQCPACRALLDEAAAAPADWAELRMSLSSDVSHEQAGDDASALDQVLKLLGPTDDPRMLGRIGGYEIVGVLGRGAMGVVFKGLDAALNRYVAIKVLQPHLAVHGAARQRFAREAQAAAAVVDDHVMAIHGVAEWQGIPYLVMPYTRSVSLQKRLSDKGPLALREILRIGMQTAAGLAAAHAQGLVHRDVKPANILLLNSVERVKLTDFGLARAVDDASLTRTGVLTGTPQYMSPEQARGQAVDSRSDLFSLGSVLYALATGRPPFRAESSYGVLRLITDEEPQPIRELNADVPEWLCRIIARLMAKRPDDRYSSAHEVADLLEKCLAHVQQPTATPLPAEVALLPKSRRPVFFNRASAMIASFGIFVLGLFAWQATTPPDIAGEWEGEEWGRVLLKAAGEGEFAGTYSDKVGKQSGELRLKWSRMERRYNGTWRERVNRFGELSVRPVENEIRGAYTTDPKSKFNPDTPHLADLRWIRPMAKTVEDVKSEDSSAGFGPVIERTIPNHHAIDFFSGRISEWPAEWRNTARTGEIPAERRWIVDTGIAASPLGGELIGHGTLAMPAKGGFDDAMPEQVTKATKDLNLKEHGLRPTKMPYPITLFFKTREDAIGILQITGPAESNSGVKIRYKLVQASAPAQSSEKTKQSTADKTGESSAAFGPVIERIIPFGAPCRAKYIQFHTGAIFEVGTGPDDKSDHAEQWKRIELSGGVDATLMGGKDSFQLAGEGSLFSKDSAPDWNKTTAEEVAKQLRRETWITGVIEGKRAELPLTYLLKTASGECGILRIEDIVAHERGEGKLGLKLKYKLVQKTTKTPADVAIAGDKMPERRNELTDLEKKFIGRWIGTRRGGVLTLVLSADRTFRETIAYETTTNRETAEASEGTWTVEASELPPTLVRHYTRSNYERLDGIVTKTKVVGLDDSSLSFPNADDPLQNITYRRSEAEPPAAGGKGVGTSAEPKEIPKPAEDADPLEGKWSVLKVRVTGPHALDEAGVKEVHIAGKKITFGSDQKDRGETMAFSLDPSKNPKEIDLTGNEVRGLAPVYKGIYQVDGDELRIAFTRNQAAGAARPANFDVTKRGDRVYTLKRLDPPGGPKETPGDGGKPTADEKKPERANELGVLEKKLVGTWDGYSDRFLEGYTFRADGTFQQVSIVQSHKTEEGTWAFDWNALPPTLVLRITKSDSKEAPVGTVFRHRVVGVDEKRLRFENPNAEPSPWGEARPITYIRHKETSPGDKPAPKRGKGQLPVGNPRRADVQGKWSDEDNGLAQVFFTLDLKDDGSFVLTRRDTAVKFEDQTLGVWEMGVDVTRPGVILRKKRWLKDGKAAEGREGFDILSLTRGDGEWLLHHPKHGTYHKHSAAEEKQKPPGDNPAPKDATGQPDTPPKADKQEDRVSPTFELNELIRDFESRDVPEIKGIAESEQRWRAFRKEGKTMWGSEKWMKEPKYYQGLKTPELAKECFRDSIFALEILKYRTPQEQFGFVSLKIMHDGFAELFGRDDMWQGIIAVYEHLGLQLKADADLLTVVRISLTFEALTALYRDPAFKKQLKGREAQFLEANLGALKRYRKLLVDFENGKVEREAVGFFREPVSVAQVALVLTKQVDPKHYAAIAPGLTEVTFSREQDAAELNRFLDAVIAAVEPTARATTDHRSVE